MLTPRSLSALAALRLEAVVGVLYLVMLAAPTSAQILDPATLHTGTGAGTTCATGGAANGPCQYLYQNHTEVNGIGPNGFGFDRDDRRVRRE